MSLTSDLQDCRCVSYGVFFKNIYIFNFFSVTYTAPKISIFKISILEISIHKISILEISTPKTSVATQPRM